MNELKFVGQRVIREDSQEKVRGQYDYLADSLPTDALYGVPILSSCANALVKNIDTSELPQGAVVLTAADAPDGKYNSGEWFPGQSDFRDETVLTAHARHIGDRVGLVLAASEEKAREALKTVIVDYEELPAVTDMKAAKENAALLHEDGVSSLDGKLGYGDADAAFKNAAHVETDTIYTPKIHHAAMETHCVLAMPKPGGAIEVHTPCQIVFGVQHCVAQVLPLPLSKIRVVKANMGGTFGGKQEAVFEPLCAWAAWKLKRPVFVNTNRAETMLSTRTRAAMLGTVSTALDENGMITARSFDITADAGAYFTGTKKVMMAMGKKASRLYRIPAMSFRGSTVRTSTTPAGACRGYGSPQIHTITEIHTDLLCKRLGYEPLAFRLKNLVRDGDKDPSGASDIGKARVIECLEKGAERFGWEALKEPRRSDGGRFVSAAGFACCTHGNGYYKTVYHDVTKMSVRILEDGSVILRTAVHELGNGTLTALAQIVAEVMDIPVSMITVTEGDTDVSSYDAGCQASRVIYVCGECARLAAEEALKLLCSEASALYDAPAEYKNGRLFIGSVPKDTGEAVIEIMLKRRRSIEAAYEHSPESNPASFGAHFTDVTVDTYTGLVKINKYLAAHDVGQCINRNFVEGQIYGGVQMGIGMALCEELKFDRNGRPSAMNFDKYHMINAPDMPDVDVLLIEDGEPGGPYGAKSIGEICTVPVSAAIVNAVNRALGTELTELPLTPAKITAAASKRR